MAATTTIERTEPWRCRPSGFTDTLASEWSKLTARRSTYAALTIGVALSIVLTALFSVAIGSTFDEWSASQRADFDPAEFWLAGFIVASIAFSVFGVLAVAGEYSSGMIRLTLTLTPARWRVLAAKALVVVSILVPLGLLTSIGMFLVAQAIYGAYGLPVVRLGDADIARAVLGYGAVSPYFPLVGLALGFLLRSTAAAITTVLSIIWLPEVVGGLLPMWWREHVLSRLPGASVDSFTIGPITDSPSNSEPAIGALAAAAWLVLFLGGAWLTLLRRDA